MAKLSENAIEKAPTIEEEVADWLAEWKVILKLQDWTIDVKLVRAYEMDNAVGDVVTTGEQRYATVRLLHPQDFNPDTPSWEKDLETTLVHELIHIVYYVIETDDMDENTEMLFEQGINATADAMVTLLRGPRPK